jgi:hypothetical protein
MRHTRLLSMVDKSTKFGILGFLVWDVSSRMEAIYLFNAL